MHMHATLLELCLQTYPLFQTFACGAGRPKHHSSLHSSFISSSRAVCESADGFGACEVLSGCARLAQHGAPDCRFSRQAPPLRFQAVLPSAAGELRGVFHRFWAFCVDSDSFGPCAGAVSCERMECSPGHERVFAVAIAPSPAPFTDLSLSWHAGISSQVTAQRVHSMFVCTM